MDKNTIIGLLAMVLLLFGWTWYSNTQQTKRREIAREQFVKDSLANPERYSADARTEAARDAAIRDSIRREYELRQMEESERNRAAQVANLGESLVGAQSGEERIYVMENDVMRVHISSLGGMVKNIELKDFRPYNNREENLRLFADGTADFALTFYIRKSYNFAQVNTAGYYFESSQPQFITAQDGTSGTLVLRLPVDPESGAYLEYLYTIRPGEYMMDFDVRFSGMQEMTSTMTDFAIDWKASSLQNEKGFRSENNNTTVAIRHPGARKIEQLGMSDSSKRGRQSTKVQWLNFKQQFFSTAIIAEDSFSDAEYGFDTYKPGGGRIKNFSANMMVPYNANQDTYRFDFYFGPNHYSTMRQYDMRLEKVIPLGGAAISWINTGFYIPLMNFMHNNLAFGFGLIILLLTIIVKVVLLPLTYKSFKSGAKMKALKPEIDEISARFPNQEDALKKQQASSALYKKYGVSPMGGCLPMVIQFPILIALFRFFPASIELRQQSFLWADDLSSYDSVLELPFTIPMYGSHVSLFALLMAVTMFFYSKMNYKQTAAQGQPQMAGMKFMMLYLMPIMMLVILNSYSSGLTYYYTLSQLLTIGVMAGFKYFTDEHKLRAQLEAKAKTIATKPQKKKSGFQQRYEEAVRQQQAMQRQQQGGKAHTSKPQSSNMQPSKKRKK